MENLLENSELTLNKSQDSMMSATMELLSRSEVNVAMDYDEEIRKSNLRDYLETYGYMDDII